MKPIAIVDIGLGYWIRSYRSRTSLKSRAENPAALIMEIGLVLTFFAESASNRNEQLVLFSLSAAT